MKSQESDQHVLDLAARYVRRLWEVERFFMLAGNDGDLRILLDDLDPVDIRNVAEALDEMRQRVGTEPRGATDDGQPLADRPSETALLRSSVPPSFFPESRRV